MRSDVTPSVPSVAMSSMSPVPKPAIAPKIEPRRRAIESRPTSTMLDVRNWRYSVRTESWNSPNTNRTSAALTPSISVRPSSLLHQDDHGLESREVDDRVDLDRLEGVDVVVADARDRPDLQAAREHRRQRALAERAGGDDDVADLDVRRLRHAVEDERVAAAVAAPDQTDRRRVVEVGRRHGALTVGEQRHARDALPRAVDRPDQPARRRDHRVAGVHAVRGARGDRDALV